MASVFNPFTKKPDYTGDSGAVSISQVNTDPASPTAEDAWVLKTMTGAASAGKLKATMGLAFPLVTIANVGTPSYQFSYRTSEGTTKRVLLS